MEAKYYWNSKKTRFHSDILPTDFKMLIVGPSGCGKTALLMRMLLEENLMDYNKLYVFGRSLHQPEYEILKAGYENHLPKSEIINILKYDIMINEMNDKPENIAMGLGQHLDDTERGNISCEFYEDSAAIPDPNQIDKTNKNLIVFDDIMTDKNQSAPGAFFTRGRHNNIDSIYISQNYYHLPRHTIRTNSNFLILFKLDSTDTDHLYRDSGASVDFNDINEFRQICKKAWNKQYGYLVIDKSKRDLQQKYRFQLDLKLSEPDSAPEPKIITHEDNKKRRATKTCESCNLSMLSSCHAKHIKSKIHLKKLEEK